MIVSRIVNPTSDPYDTAYVDTPGVGQDEDGVVGIFYSGGFLASGALLWTGRHILTAAHVVQGLSVDGTSIGFNLTTQQFVTASAITTNPADADLAIIELSSTAPTDANRYELYTGTDEIGRTFEVHGFGIPGTGLNGFASDDSFTQRFGSNTFDVLGNHETLGWPIDTLVFDFDNGLSANDALGYLTGSAHLGLGSREVNVAPGDSGGPNFLDGKIAGVTSAIATEPATDVDSATNASFGELAVSVRVSSFVDWITTTVNTSSATTTNATVYRFYNNSSQSHFYTASESERDSIISNLPNLTYEGPTFEVADSTNSAAIDIYRLYNTDTGSHFYTASQEEVTFIGATLPQYTYEGAAYQAYSEQVTGSGALYRFFNTNNGTHFYTASDEEKASVEANLSHMTYEGIAYYVDLIG